MIEVIVAFSLTIVFLFIIYQLAEICGNKYGG